jgi:hypothetical protein
VDVIRHQAKRMNTITVPLDPFLEQQVEAISVGIIIKDVLPGVSTQYHMVECSRKMNSWFSGHGMILPPNSTIASLTPYPMHIDPILAKTYAPSTSRSLAARLSIENGF